MLNKIGIIADRLNDSDPASFSSNKTQDLLMHTYPDLTSFIAYEFPKAFIMDESIPSKKAR